MKLHKSIQTKQTTRLFNGKYKYKIVLLSKAASWFRGGEVEKIKNARDSGANWTWSKKLDVSDKAHANKIISSLELMADYTIRVESPYINFYTNNEKDVETLAKIASDRVKYVSLPLPGSEPLLDERKILVKNLDYDFRVTMGRTKSNHSNFVEWCKGKEDRVRLPKSATKHLSKDHSWGGYYFYVKDEKTLTMVKMFISEGINLVENVVKT